MNASAKARGVNPFACLRDPLIRLPAINRPTNTRYLSIYNIIPSYGQIA